MNERHAIRPRPWEAEADEERVGLRFSVEQPPALRPLIETSSRWTVGCTAAPIIGNGPYWFVIRVKEPCLTQGSVNPRWWGNSDVTPLGKLNPRSPQRHPCLLGCGPSRHGGRRLESAYRVALLLAVAGDRRRLCKGTAHSLLA